MSDKGKYFHNRFTNQMFVSKVLNVPSNFQGQIISLGTEIDNTNVYGLQLNKILGRKETNIPAYYLGFSYKIAYIEDKINPSQLATEELVLNYNSFTHNTLIAVSNSSVTFSLVIKLEDLLSDTFRQNVYLTLLNSQKKIKTLYIILDGTCDETRILYTDICNITTNTVMYGTIDDYINLDAKARYSNRTVFTKLNSVRLDLILARSVRVSNVTGVVYMPDLNFINNSKISGTTPIPGMFLPIDLYEAFCLEGNFMTYDVNLIERGQLNFPTRYNRTGNFYSNLADLVVTNSRLDINLMLNINLISEYKLEYNKLIQENKGAIK